MSDTITLFSPDELAAMAERERADNGYEILSVELNLQQNPNFQPSDVRRPVRELLDKLETYRNEYARLLAVAQWAGEAAAWLQLAGSDQHHMGCGIYPLVAHKPESACTCGKAALLARLTPPTEEKP